MFGSIEHFRQHYQMAEQIGRGAFAICYKAINKITQAVVAVKKITIIADDPPTTQNINNEVMLLHNLSHANLIKLIGAYRANKYALIVTDYQQGRDLQQKIAELKRGSKRLSQKQLYIIFGQILRGIAYLHQQNIIHRDIKPSNIFIDNQHNVKIGDLGAAKIVEELNFTRIGTPYYLPPQIIRHQNYTFSADIWSLGVTLYHLAYLQLPFKANNVIKLGQLIVQSEPQYQSGCYEWIECAIRRMLMKDEKKRPTAKQLLDQYFQNDKIIEMGVEQCEIVDLQVQQDKAQLLELQKEREDKKEANFQQTNEREQHATFKEIQLRKSVISDPHHVQSVYRDNYVLPTTTLSKRTTKIENYRFLQRKLSHIGKQTIDQNESTIILSVNAVESRQQSMITPASAQKKTFFANQSMNDFKHFKKSSCFKDTARHQSQSISSFFQQKGNKKERLSIVGHRREPSAIHKKLKHSELMQKIKPLKLQNVQREGFESVQKESKPKITACSPSFVLLR